MFQFDPTPSEERHASEMVLSGTTLLPPGAGYFCEHLISIAPRVMRGLRR